MRNLLSSAVYKDRLWKVALVSFTILVAIAAGTSFIVLPSPYSPLLILAAAAAIVAVFTWVEKPIWALYFAIFAVLLPDSLIPNQVNSYLNRITTIIALAVWLIDVIRRRRQIIISTSTLLMVLFIIWSAISLLWADYFNEGLTTLQRYVLRLILFLVLLVNEIKTKKDLDGLMNILALNGLVYFAISIYTVFVQGYSSGSRLQVLDVNENSLGLSFLITLPAVLWWSFNSTGRTHWIKNSFAVIYLITTIGFTGLSGSRGSAISLGLTLLIFLFWKPTRSWGLLSLILVGAAIAMAPIVFSTTIERFLGSPGESILGGRETMWPAGWQLITAHPFLGVGIGNSSFQVLPLVWNIIVRLLARDSVSLHNPVLTVWAETGLPGIVFYLGILVAAVISFVKQYFRSRKSSDQHLLPYYALISSVFIGYMASWIKGGGMESGYTYFLILALLILPANLTRFSIEKNPE